MYKYFDTAFVNVVAVYGRRLPLAHGVSDTWKMINRHVRKGISIIRGQSESHPSICFVPFEFRRYCA